jgi:tRNA(fMet)-specific endonuclease VapC
LIRRFMLDTNQISDIVKGHSIAARVRLERLNFNEVACVSAITEAELLYGVAKRPHATVLKRSLEEVLMFLQVLPWGHEESAVYGKLRAKQEALGKPLAAMDLLIASHAIATQSILVSRDKAFAHVGDLPALTNWSTDLIP